MKKFRKIAIIVVVVVGVLYGGYMLFINPSGYTDKTELTQDFFLDIQSTTACDKYFNVETTSYCESFTTLFDGETIVIDNITASSGSATVTISIGATSDTFTVTFVEIPVTGMKRFFNSEYYKIDMIT